MRGLLIYNDDDLKKNQSFANWIIEEFDKNSIDVDILTREDYYRNRRLNYKYDFVINRSRDYNLSLTFELSGVRVFNDSTITLLGNNKLAAYKYAHNKKTPYPPIIENLEDNESFLTKPIYGHGGQDIYLNEEDAISEHHLLQEFIKDVQGDIRFYILDNKIIHAVIRSNKGKITSNYSQGGEFDLYNYNKSEESYIMEFIEGLSIDYAGVDFFLLKDGKLLFNEIEDVVGSRMLSELKINDTVPEFVNHIISKIMLDK